jgi:hypothetical protein
VKFVITFPSPPPKDVSIVPSALYRVSAHFGSVVS